MNKPLSMTAGLLVGLLCLIGGLLAAFMVGRFSISISGMIQLLSDIWQGRSLPGDPIATIVINIRGPRIIGAIVIGASLAMAGAAYQGLFRNPLVSPDLLGASTGAALGTVLGIFFSLGIVAIQGAAFSGGILAVVLVYSIAATLRADDRLLILVLTGVVLGSLLGACIGLIKYLADPYNQLPAMTFWLLGSLSSFNKNDLPLLIFPSMFGAMILFALRWQMNAMSMPEEEARALGVRTELVRSLVILAATLLTAASVTAAGVIGWIGLIVPHIARFLVGPSFHALLPTSALIGASFLLLIDTAARSIAPIEIPLGILTALMGAPVFIWVMANARKSWA